MRQRILTWVRDVEQYNLRYEKIHALTRSKGILSIEI